MDTTVYLILINYRKPKELFMNKSHQSIKRKIDQEQRKKFLFYNLNVYFGTVHFPVISLENWEHGQENGEVLTSFSYIKQAATTTSHDGVNPLPLLLLI